ncbi:hypothetical protein [Fulvivirga ligni]|uniref:hypothetical protein n=1 Tax=Fulvivirga ligni TaxID=2904246 RepID=UPI001F1ABE9C|nr:hypothetical protein [Fulvivirga ligni]UII21290.1 hypothetical protein LVD16_26010 [Fulvivirga ligni]
MDNSFDKLKENWGKARVSASSRLTADGMLNKAKSSYAKSKKDHIANTVILSLVVVGLAMFFYYLAPLQDTFSRVGIGFMIGGLLLRILIELISHAKASKIIYDDNAAKSTGKAADFYNWRKSIHGPVTFAIVTLYSIGWYMLTPEFMRYIDLKYIYLMDIGYVFIMIILFLIIRKGVIKELKQLKALQELEQSFLAD